MGWIDELSSKERYFMMKTIRRFEARNLRAEEVLDEIDRELDIWKPEPESWDDPLLARLAGLFAKKDRGEDLPGREFIKMMDQLKADTYTAEELYRLGTMLEMIELAREGKATGQALLLGLNKELWELEEWYETWGWGSVAFDMQDVLYVIERELDYLSDNGHSGRTGTVLEWNKGGVAGIANEAEKRIRARLMEVRGMQ